MVNDFGMTKVVTVDFETVTTVTNRYNLQHQNDLCQKSSYCHYKYEAF